MRNVVITNEGRKLVTDKEAFKHYRENNKFRDINIIKGLKIYRKVVITFYKKIAEKLVENDGGVFVENLGYFSILLYPKKQHVRVPYNKKGFSNFRTNNRLFLPSFFGISKRNPLMNFWVMDRTFSKGGVKEKLYDKIISGKRYKTFISTLSSLYLIEK